MEKLLPVVRLHSLHLQTLHLLIKDQKKNNLIAFLFIQCFFLGQELGVKGGVCKYSLREGQEFVDAGSH